ncbi:MAG: acyl-CoA dehydrogenase [Proteobacteria bacterium]|nr:acyl-CoA dehydrogenase [Pseudomonadota bacterium]
MAYVLTEEQRLIQTMARDFAQNELIPTAAERDRTKEFPWEILAQMGELGFLGMMIPEEYGGVGLDAVSYVCALSEIAYGCASTAVVMSVQNSVCCEPIVAWGTEDVKRRFLPRLATGEILGSFALTEPHAGSDPAAQRTTAVRDGSEWVINGTKQFITTGANSGVTVVTAVTEKEKRHGGVTAFLVEKGTPGFNVGKAEEKMGLRASDTVQLVFEDCRVPDENILGGEGMGFRIAMTALDSGRVGIAAQSVGVAQAALDMAVGYAKEREAFGKPIAMHQGLRFMMADMATEIEAARLMMFNAASMKDRGEHFTAQASMAKLFSSEMVNRVVSRALQIHGGYGYCQEFPIERLYRDARVFTIYEGTSEIQRIVISNHLLGPVK